MMISTISGRLGRDPQTRTTRNDKRMVTVSVAVDVTPAKTEDQDRETLWINVVAFGKNADKLEKQRKGDQVYVMGRVTQGRWVGKDGEARVGFSILADAINCIEVDYSSDAADPNWTPPDGQSSLGPPEPQPVRPQSGGPQSGGQEAVALPGDDEVPF